MIACIDVAYQEDHAHAACVVLEQWADATPILARTAALDRIAPCEPENFYCRELPAKKAISGIWIAIFSEPHAWRDVAICPRMAAKRLQIVKVSGQESATSRLSSH